MPDATTQYISPAALAARWKFHPESIRRRIRCGSLSAIRLGGRLRVPIEAVEEIERDARVIRGNRDMEETP